MFPVSQGDVNLFTENILMVGGDIVTLRKSIISETSKFGRN
jgi:hypothetical protein